MAEWTDYQDLPGSPEAPDYNSGGGGGGDGLGDAYYNSGGGGGGGGGGGWGDTIDPTAWGGSMGGAGEEAQRSYLSGGGGGGGGGGGDLDEDARRQQRDDAFWNAEFERLGIGKPGPQAPQAQPPAYPGGTTESLIKPSPRGGGGGGGRGGGGFAGGAFQAPTPYMPTQAPTPGKFTPEKFQPGTFGYTGPDLAIPEYKPPGEDKGYERGKREEFSAPGRSRLGRKTSEAILAGRNIDNPAARTQFMKSLVTGYGEGLSGVMGEAGRSAGAAAARKRSEDLSIYASNWSGQAEMARTKYTRDFSTQLNNFVYGEQARQSNTAAANQAGMFNVQNANQAAMQNWQAQDTAQRMNWQLGANMYQKSPAFPGQAIPSQPGKRWLSKGNTSTATGRQI